MNCPACKGETRVIDSREAPAAVRRRRECLTCARRFTTYERFEEQPLMVRKKNGDREIFNPTKLLNGLLRACEKRPITSEALQELVALLEQELRSELQSEVESSEIGERALRRLRGLDRVAYVRFASVYRHFETPQEFEAELQRLSAL